MSNPLLTWPHADARKRIHIRAVGDAAEYRRGPTGHPHKAASIGDAFEQAIAGVDFEEAVIIFEGRAG